MTVPSTLPAVLRVSGSRHKNASSSTRTGHAQAIPTARRAARTAVAVCSQKIIFMHIPNEIKKGIGLTRMAGGQYADSNIRTVKDFRRQHALAAEGCLHRNEALTIVPAR